MALSNKAKAWVSAGVATIGAFWGFHEWVGKVHLPVHLMTRAEAQSLGEQVKAAADTAKTAADAAKQTSDRLFDYIEREQLRDERAALERLEGDLQDTLLWENANGANDLSRARKTDLTRRIADARERIRCLENPGAGGC